MTDLPLSVIILAHRFDERLRAAIRSADLAAEVVVVNLSSATPPNLSGASHQREQYLKYPGNLLEDGWDRVRNWSLGQIHQPWVFLLDSDEIIESGSIKEIATVINRPEVTGARIIRREFFLGRELRWGEAGRQRLIRLARTEKVHFMRPVHEVAVVDGRVIDTAITIRHHSHPSTADFVSKISLYSYLEANYRRTLGQTFNGAQLLFFPPAKFFYNYFLKLGCLDGFPGLIYALVMSIHSLSVRVNLYEQDHA